MKKESLKNRVSANGEIYAVPNRGTYMGNRGLLHNEKQEIQRDFKLKAWIICKLKYKNRQREVMKKNRYTELFFLDEATSFSAGHRPCAECRRKRYNEFKDAWLKGNEHLYEFKTSSIKEIDEIIHTQRVIDNKKVTFKDNIENLPNGTFFEFQNKILIIWNNEYYEWSFEGYKEFKEKIVNEVSVLTPKSYVLMFQSGFIPKIHSSLKDLIEKKEFKNQFLNDLIYLPYNKSNFDSDVIFGFMKKRLVKGVELIANETYYRTFRINSFEGHFSIKDNKDKSRLEAKIMCDDFESSFLVYKQIKKMFDLNTDLKKIASVLKDKVLLKSSTTIPRLPMGFDAYEFIIRAILGQQITVSAATTLAGRIAQKANIKYKCNIEGLNYFFPTVDELSKIDLNGIGITKTRVNTIKSMNDALKNGELSLEYEQNLDDFINSFTKIKGIGDWTANYIAMRGLGMKDAFPANDLGVIKALTTKNQKPNVNKIIEKAEKWRPYRAYATLCLWINK